MATSVRTGFSSRKYTFTYQNYISVQKLPLARQHVDIHFHYQLFIVYNITSFNNFNRLALNSMKCKIIRLTHHIIKDAVSHRCCERLSDNTIIQLITFQLPLKVGSCYDSRCGLMPIMHRSVLSTLTGSTIIG